MSWFRKRPVPKELPRHLLHARRSIVTETLTREKEKNQVSNNNSENYTKISNKQKEQN